MNLSKETVKALLVFIYTFRRERTSSGTLWEAACRLEDKLEEDLAQHIKEEETIK